MTLVVETPNGIKRHKSVGSYGGCLVTLNRIEIRVRVHYTCLWITGLSFNNGSIEFMHTQLLLLRFP